MSVFLRRLNSWTVSIGSIEGVHRQALLEDELWTDRVSGWTVYKISNLTDQYCVAFWGNATAYVSMSSKEIHICPISPEISSETLQHLVLDQVLPRVMAHEGHLVIHASAIAKNGSAIVIIGPSGYGKSTMAGSFLEADWSLMGDDAFVILQVGDCFMGKAVYQSLRLNPDSVDEIFQVRPELSQVSPYTSKQRVAFQRDMERAIPQIAVSALFFLAPDQSNNHISLRPMRVAESCMGIISNSFSLDPTDTGLAANKLAAASAAAEAIPAFELFFPREYSKLPDVHAAIQDQLALLKEAGNASEMEMEYQ
jgi:hypothetical protein